MLIANVDNDEEDRELFNVAVGRVNPNISCKLFTSCAELFDFMETTVTLPDFLFMDINMPKINGYQCVQRIRAQNKFKHLKIIIHSTAFNPDDQKEFEDLRLEFLLKPLRLSDLVQSLQKIVSLINSGDDDSWEV
jgi:CheY-like chemotaxis protein